MEALLDLLPALEGELRAASGGTLNPFAEDDHFNDWALRIREAQSRAYPVLRRFWATRSQCAPTHWTDIPPVPAEAFKALPLGPPDAEAVFRTSGTSRSRARRGEHRIARLSLYHAAARGPYRAALFQGVPKVRVLSLIPHPEVAPESSLARMAGFIAEEEEVDDAAWYFRPDRGVNVDECVHWLRLAERGDLPVLVLTTAFALVQLLDRLADGPVGLPEGSALMETGGFKGADVSIDRADLYLLVGRRLGISPASIVGEYGMTELLSQSYDARVGSASALAKRRHRFPPWVRTRVLDPSTLRPAAPGLRGLLCHFDLANAGSVCHVLTEDVGIMDEDGGFRLLGRASGSETRGCSLMAESFVRSVQG